MPHGKPAEGVIRANFSISEALWETAKAKAHDEGKSLAEVLREFLREYVGQPESPHEARTGRPFMGHRVP